MLHLIGSRDVLTLTGLSSNQLREWTVRRALIPADIPAKERGSEAKFGWQTVLLLRLALVLKNQFRVELKAHQALLQSARSQLKGTSFPTLIGKSLIIQNLADCEIILQKVPPQSDCITLHLDPHLEILSREFRMTAPSSQLPLFRAVLLNSSRVDSADNEMMRGGIA